MIGRRDGRWGSRRDQADASDARTDAEPGRDCDGESAAAPHDESPGEPASDNGRRALIDLLVYAYDRTSSPGVRSRLAEGLRAAGVEVVVPDGEPFDPGRHEAGGVQPTEDKELAGIVAETETAGFADRGSVIREPVVVVYRFG